MEYRYLGRTGMKVSELCLGAMTFGREAPEEDSYPMLARFVAAGGNFIVRRRGLFGAERSKPARGGKHQVTGQLPLLRRLRQTHLYQGHSHRWR